MKLTRHQDEALTAINAWLRNKAITRDNWLFTLAGYAGTGKTTLLQHLINNMGDKPICCAPTGKAASVLKAKLKTVMVNTVHQVLYQPSGRNLETLDRLVEAKVAYMAENPKPDIKRVKALDTAIEQEKDRLATQKVNFSTKPNLENLRGRTIIIDEASMVSRRMMEDFCGLGCRVLMVGDCFQLPPVNSQAWFVDREHNAMLTEVMRQALDSPIIRLSVQIRNRDINVSDFKTGDCQLMHKSDLAVEDWLAADQVLTGSNASRHRINRFFRKKFARDHSNLPVAGDKLICLKNDHYKMPCWINGIQFLATRDCEPLPCGEMGLHAEYEGVHFNGIEFYTHPCLSHYDEAAVPLEHEEREGLFECDYAYCITTHKAQGSEFDFVIVADDRMRDQDKEFRAKWLYTAATRAKKRLIIAQ